MSPDQRPLRVLHLTAGSDAGGVSRYLLDLCLSLHERGHRVSIAGRRGAWHNRFAAAPWPWLELPMDGSPLDLFRASRSLRRLLEREPVDLLHAHYRKATLVARRLAHWLNIPVLFTLHLTGIPLSFPWSWLTDWGDHVHTPAHEGGRWLRAQAGLAPERITVIPHGIDSRKFPVASEDDRREARAELGLAGATIAAFVGRFDRPKNEDWMLDLAAASAHKLPHLHCVLAGGGPHEAQLRRQVIERKLNLRVTVFGERDPLAVYRAADAVLLPSALEGFSLVNAEAMSVGRPVLRTRTAGTEEQIIENVTGRSVAIDRDAFVSEALSFLSDKAVLAKMGAAAAAHVRKHLTHDRQVDATVALYRKLIGGRS